MDVFMIENVVGLVRAEPSHWIAREIGRQVPSSLLGPIEGGAGGGAFVGAAVWVGMHAWDQT